MEAGAEGHAGSRHLRNPPHLAHPEVIASHHPITQVIHYQRTDLRGRVDGSGMGKGSQQRIGLRAISARKGAPGRPGVKTCRSMAGCHQAVPDFFLSRGFVAVPGRSLYSGIESQRLSARNIVRCGRVAFNARCRRFCHRCVGEISRIVSYGRGTRRNRNGGGRLHRGSGRVRVRESATNCEKSSQKQESPQ